MKRKYHGAYDKYGRLLLPVTVDKDGITNTALPEIAVTPYKRNLREDVDKGKKEFVNKALEIAEGTGLAAAIGGVAGGVGKSVITKSVKPIVNILKPIIGSTIGYGIGNKIDKANGGKTNYKTAGVLLGGVIGVPIGNTIEKGINIAIEKTNPMATQAIKTINRAKLDKYSSPMGYLGYYGGIKDRLVQTLIKNGSIKESVRFKEKIKHPELLRKLRDKPELIKGKIDLASKTGTPVEGELITNFTTDRPVVSNGGVYWDDADLYILNPKVVKNETPINIEPSDHFYQGFKSLAKPKDVTLISGNVEALKAARKDGMPTLSSKRARILYENMIKNNDKNSMPKSNEARVYADEIQRLQARRGTPNIDDYKAIENKYNLETGVVPFNKEVFKTHRDYARDYNEGIFPNGIERNAKGLGENNSIVKELDRAKYNKVFYDPATPKESKYRNVNGKEKPQDFDENETDFALEFFKE